MFLTTKWFGPVDSGDGRLQWRCARGKNQCVVGFFVFASGFPLAHPDAPGGAIDADDLGFDAHIQIEARLEALGRLHQQAVLLGDFTTDKIRQSAVGKRHMRAALEHDDLAVLAQPSRACCRAGSTCDAADDDKAFVVQAFHLQMTVMRTWSLFDSKCPSLPWGVRLSPPFVS